MSCHEREHAWRRVKGEVVMESEVVRRLVVSSIARLCEKYLGFPMMLF